MKYISKSPLFLSFILFIFYSNTITAQTYFVNDSTNNYRNTKIENYIQEEIKANLLDFDKESYNSSLDILDTKEKAAIFAKQIAIFRFPEYKKTINKNCVVTEDKTSKLWLVRIKLAKSALDGELTLLILKRNCKIILLTNHF